MQIFLIALAGWIIGNGLIVLVCNAYFNIKKYYIRAKIRRERDKFYR